METLELTLKRIALRETYTIGRLFVGAVRACDTLEDKDRGLYQSMGDALVRSLKVYGETAIPKGRYRIDMETASPKYNGVAFYRNLCGGRVPRLCNVPGFDGILIHTGNTALDTYGCILVGQNTQVGKVLNSRDTFTKLYRILEAAHRDGKEIFITIQ